MMLCYILPYFILCKEEERENRVLVHLKKEKGLLYLGEPIFFSKIDKRKGNSKYMIFKYFVWEEISILKDQSKI